MVVFSLVNIKLFIFKLYILTIPNKEDKVHNLDFNNKKIFYNFIFLWSEILIQDNTEMNRILTIPDPLYLRSVYNMCQAVDWLSENMKTLNHHFQLTECASCLFCQLPPTLSGRRKFETWIEQYSPIAHKSI